MKSTNRLFQSVIAAHCLKGLAFKVPSEQWYWYHFQKTKMNRKIICISEGHGILIKSYFIFT